MIYIHWTWSSWDIYYWHRLLYHSYLPRTIFLLTSPLSLFAHSFKSKSPDLESSVVTIFLQFSNLYKCYLMHLSQNSTWLSISERVLLSIVFSVSWMTHLDVLRLWKSFPMRSILWVWVRFLFFSSGICWQQFLSNWYLSLYTRDWKSNQLQSLRARILVPDWRFVKLF